MKTHQKFAVADEEKTLLKHIERFDKNVDHRYLELRSRKRLPTNPLIQKNINFLRGYNNLFAVPPRAEGVDRQFRNSLRNLSGRLDLVRDLNLPYRRPDRPRPKSVFTTCDSLSEYRELLSKKPLGQGEPSDSSSFLKQIYSRPASKSSSESDSLFRASFRTPDAALISDAESFSCIESKEVQVNSTELLLVENPSLKNLSEESPLTEYQKSLLLKVTYSSSNENLKFAQTALESIYEMAEADVFEEEMNMQDDEMEEIEQMIKEASVELEKVSEENRKLLDTLDEKDEEEGEEETNVGAETNKMGLEGIEPKTSEKGYKKKPDSASGDSVFKFNQKIDTAVLRELDAAEKQAAKDGLVIKALVERMTQLLQKETMTKTEATELEEKNKELRDKMMQFDEKTKRVQDLIAQLDLFDIMRPIQPPLQSKHHEDILPKMLVCGMVDELMPRIVLCRDKAKRSDRRRSSSKSPVSSGPPKNASTLSDSRYQNASSPLRQNETITCLQNQLCSLQNEMKMVYQENQQMFNQQQEFCPNPQCPKNSRSNSPVRKGAGKGSESCGPGRGLCPADIENRLQEYSNTTSNMEKQLVDVEEEVRNIQQELLDVQKEREHLEHHRKMLAMMHPCPAPCPRPPCMPPPCGYPPSCMPPPCCPPEASSDDKQSKEIKEKYARLTEDFKLKLTEVAGLRADNERLKEIADKADEVKSKLELKIKELEKKLKDLRGEGDKGVGSKEQLIDIQQQLKVHKEMYRQAQDELEELRALVEDLQRQTNDYRNKYLDAIQAVEEQRRQMDMMRMENNRISEQVNLEIVRVKNQFAEKLQELAPLPDILKATQNKLQEAQQMHLLAERNNESLAKELQMYKDKLQAIEDEMALADSNKSTGLNLKEAAEAKIARLEQELEECKEEKDNLKIDMDRLKEQSDENGKLASTRLHEIAQLETQLENVREESARQVARIKDRCEIVRKSTQNQLNDMERQLAQTKASAKTAEKDRDDIRQKMQAQIRNLNENFEDAQMRIRNLQGHVNFLKNTYTSPAEMVAQDERSKSIKPLSKGDPCCCGAEY